MYHLLLALAFQMDPGPQAHQELVIQLQLRQMQEDPRYSKIKQQREDAREAAIKDYFFAQKFNKLVDKLKAFTNSYNSGKVDAKAVADLKKAWRSLEKEEGWFHEEKSKRNRNDGEEKNLPKEAKVEACGTS